MDRIEAEGMIFTLPLLWPHHGQAEVQLIIAGPATCQYSLCINAAGLFGRVNDFLCVA